jgi:Predicted xylanase/chitin deacetylase
MGRISLKKYLTYIITFLIVVGIVTGLCFTLREYRNNQQLAVHSPTSLDSVPSAPSTDPTQPGQENQPGPDNNNASADAISILMYHVIATGPNNLFVPADAFDAQMDYLHQKGYHTVTMAAAAEMLTSRHILAKTMVLTFDDGYESVYTAAWPIMRKYGFTGTIYVCSSFPGRPNYLSWDEIRALHANGMEIGSHTRNHIDLKKAAPDVQREEIMGSKKILEEQLGIPVVSFCYPSGAYNDQTPAIVKEAGYTSAVTVAYGHASSQDNIYLLSRVRVSGGLPLSKFTQMIP